MPVVAAMTVWIWLFDRRRGVVNYLLDLIPGVDMNQFNWIGGEPFVFFIVASHHRDLDVGALRRLLGLRRPHPGLDEVVEASQLDGATGWQRLRFIVLPMIRPVIMIVLLLNLIWDLRVFTQITMLQDAGSKLERLRPARHLHLQAGRRGSQLRPGRRDGDLRARADDRPQLVLHPQSAEGGPGLMSASAQLAPASAPTRPASARTSAPAPTRRRRGAATTWGWSILAILARSDLGVPGLLDGQLVDALVGDAGVVHARRSCRSAARSPTTAASSTARSSARWASASRSR